MRTYSSPGVSDACLVLQNSHGADVNMLLYCCWVGGRLGGFDTHLFARAIDFSAKWTGNVVAPLRSARSWMKNTGCALESVPTETCMQLREDIKAVELATEKLQLEVLESLPGPEEIPDRPADRLAEDILANLKLYADYEGFEFNDDVQRLCAIMIVAAFPDCDAALRSKLPT